jgi:hypothetical protein
MNSEGYAKRRLPCSHRTTPKSIVYSLGAMPQTRCAGTGLRHSVSDIRTEVVAAMSVIQLVRCDTKSVTSHHFDTLSQMFAVIHKNLVRVRGFQLSKRH